MLKRLLIGLAKGLVTGGALGALFQLGLGWPSAAGLLGYLLAMGAAATAGTVAGKPPWRQEAWIEGVLKSGFGLGIGALLFWVATSFLSFDLPFALGPIPAGVPWVSQPLLMLPPIAAVYGAIIELDNTGDGKAATKTGRKVRHVRVRGEVAGEPKDAVAEAPAEPRKRSRKR